MNKLFSKLSKILLCMVLFLTVMTQNVAARSFKLTSSQLLPEILVIPSSLSTWGGVSYLHVTEYADDGSEYVYSAWCIEPDVLAVEGSSYTIDPNIDTSVAKDVILNYYLNYRDHELYSTLGGYYAVQVAVWGRIKGVDPSTLALGTAVSTDAASKVRALAHDLYATSANYNPTSVLYVGGNKVLTGNGSYDIGDLTTSQFLYEINGQYYWRTPLLSVSNSHKNSTTKTLVDISSIEGAILTDTNYKERTKVNGKYEIGDGTSIGSMFYVFIPTTSGGEAVNNGTISISTAVDIVDVVGWNGNGSQNFASIWDGQVNTSNTLTMSWKPVTKVQTNATITVEKVGNGPKSATISSVGGWMDYYEITTGTIPLKGTGFGAYFYDDLSTVYKYVKFTDANGQAKWDVEDIESHVQTDAVGDYVQYIICETQAPEGYLISGSFPVDWNGYKCALYVDDAPFDISLTGDKAIVNNAKTFSVNINKKDNLGNNLEGISFGLFNTKPITLYEGSVSEIPAGSLVGYGKTDANGNLTLGANLPANQDYELRELFAIDGISPIIHSISVDGVDKTANLDNNGVLIELGDFKTNADATKTFAVNVVNNRVENLSNYNLTIHKVDQNGDAVPLAEFEVSDGTNTVATGTTDGNGDLIVNIPEGIYFVNETTTPDGYEPAERQSIYLTSDQTLTILNNKWLTDTIVINKELNLTPASGNPTFNFLVEKEVDGVKVSEQSVSLDWATDRSVSVDVDLDAIGTITYRITELDSSNNKISTDNSVYTVTYVLNHDNDGKLVLASKEMKKNGNDANLINFINTFTPDELSVRIQVAKNVRNEIAGSGNSHFAEFTMTDSTNELGKSTIRGETIDGKFGVFGLSVLNAGHQYYKIYESDTNSYMTKDSSYYTIEFDVEMRADDALHVVDNNYTIKHYDENDNLLEATTTDSINLPFTNTYVSTGNVVLNLEKVIEGNNDENRPFYLNIECNGENGTIDMLGSAYTNTYTVPLKQGTVDYSCTITEIPTTYSHYQPNTESYTVTWSMVDDGEGNMSAVNFKINGTDATQNDKIKFTNVYITPLDIDFSIKKVLNNTNNTDYTFDFSVGGDLTENLTMDFNNGDIIKTGKVVSEEPESFNFTFEETTGDVSNIEYDGSKYELSFDTKIENNKIVVDEDSVVMKKDGQVITWNYGDDIVFNNYLLDEAPITINISKTIAGDYSNIDSYYLGRKPEATNFSANVSIVDADGTEVYSKQNATFSSDTAWTGNLTLPKGNYQVIISEVEGSEHFVYDDTVYRIPLTVGVDSENHKFAVMENGSVVNGLVEVEFTNEYKPQEAVGQFGIYKEVIGDEQINSEDKFTFSVEGNGISEVFSIPASANKESVKTIDYSFAKAGTYTFTIKELSNNSLKPNWYEDVSGETTVTVVVKDNNGVLEASVDSQDNGLYKMINRFTWNFAPIAETLTIHKTSNTNKPDSFDFEVFDGDALVESPSIQIGSSKDVNLTLDSIGTHTFKVTETSCLDRYTCDDTAHTVEIDVARNGYDLYVSKILVDGEEKSEADLTIFNEYAWEAIDVDINFTKEYTGYEGGVYDHAFTFTLENLDDDTDTDSTTIHNPMNRTSLKFTRNYDQPVIETFELREETGTDPMTNYDDTPRVVQVKIEDEQGVLKATVVNDNIEFVNEYVKPEEVSAKYFGFNISKNVEGKTSDNNRFKFDVLNELNENTEVVISMNDSVSAERPFSVAIKNAGNHWYEVSEQDLGYHGYDFDETVYVVNIKTKIEREEVVGNGIDVYKKDSAETLTLVKSYASDETATVNFTNVFTPDPVKASFTVKKNVTYTDQAPQNKETFKFSVGSEEFTVAAGSEVTYTFDGLFTEGEYRFVLKEVNTGIANYKYSDEKYLVVVNVVRDGDELKSTTTIKKDDAVFEKAVFTNVYDKKAEQPKPTPKPSKPIENTSAY